MERWYGLPLNDDFKYRVKLANPLESVVANYVTIKRSGRNYTCCCPFHSEKTPSFYINVDDGFYKCFGCGESGDVFSFIMKIENLDFKDALKLLAERAGLQMPNYSKNDVVSKEKTKLLEMYREAGRYFYSQLRQNRVAIQYMKDRRLNANVVLKEYNLGYSGDNWVGLTNHLRSLNYSDEDIAKSGLAKYNSRNVLYDFFHNRLMVPIKNVRGDIIAFGGRTIYDEQPKYLNSPDTNIFKKSEQLFSLNLAKQYTTIHSTTRTLILVEGYMDVIGLYQVGFKNAIASLGTSLTPEQINIIKRYCDQVIICYDNDGAGIKATNRAINLFYTSSNSTDDFKVKVAQVVGAKDPDEYIKNNGEDGVAKFKLILENSVDAIDFQIDRVRSEVNLNTNSGKVEMIKQCIQIVAKISNEATRDVYVHSIAKDCNVEPSTLTDSIKMYLNNSSNTNHYYNKIYTPIRQNNNYYYVNNSSSKDNTNIDRPKDYRDLIVFQKKYNSERTIIAYMLQYPEYITAYKDLLPPEKFSNQTNRRILTAIYVHADGLQNFNDKSILHDSLSEEDFSSLIDVCQQYKDRLPYDTAQRGISDCIENLEANYTSKLDSNNLYDLNQIRANKQQQHHRFND